jgi:sodium/potassium/calcium exchanger 6
LNPLQCRLVRHAKDQCAFVQNNCPDEDGLISYLQLYYCSLRHVQPLAFIILVLWLSLLFSTIGIAASDFLCINLSTIASILGMSESLAGVTFLAFGNGSPDVFSTFAAMGSNSGSLAIGELIGAACFITAVVAGSMALVRPFRVARRSFVRDILFFIVAAAFSMVVLADGKLHVWECAAMIGLYLFYVVLVVSWHWYLTRQRRRYEREFAARAQFHIPDSQELDLQERAVDDDPVAGETTSLLHDSSNPDFDALERAAWPAWKDGEDDDEARNQYLAEIQKQMHVTRPTPSRRRATLNPIRPSLVGALEFQSVLSSLQRSKNIHDRSIISLAHYSDDPYAAHSHRPDNLSLSSHPGANLEPLADEETASGGNRLRSVSMNDAAHLRIDTTVADSRKPPSGNAVLLVPPQISLETEGEPSRVESSAMLTTSPTSFGYPSRSQTPSPDGRQRSSDHLTVPEDMFHAPDYQASPHSRGVSPSGVSPGAISPMSARQTPQISFSLEPDDDRHQALPFPAYADTRGSFSSRASSLRLPAATFSSSSEVDSDSHFLEDLDRESKRLRWWPSWFLPPPWLIMSTLFPTMYDWRAKNIWGKLLGIVAAPSVFLLTMTVPVVEPHRSSGAGESSSNDGHEPAILVRLPEESPVLPPRSDGLRNEQQNMEREPRKVRRSSLTQNRPRLDSEMPAVPSHSTTGKEWHRWLVYIQIFTAPLFAVVVAWLNLDEDRSPRTLLIPILCSLGLSVVCGALLHFGDREPSHSQPPNRLRPVFAFVGFIVGISWIATIANEVVSLLKTFGVILSISDSLLGLTVFAVGNSLGDLVADITVARLGYPVMALSACFGGPMLNILLGIGIGGLYMTWHSKQSMSPIASDAVAANGTYEIVISKTLAISGATLLVTLVGLLIIVPLNHWKMDRRIGWGLIALWVLSTFGNVIVEIMT